MSDRKRGSYHLDFEDVKKSFGSGNYIRASCMWYSIFKRERENGRVDKEFPDSFIDLGLEVNEKAFTEMYVHNMACGSFESDTHIIYDSYIDSMILKLGKKVNDETVKGLLKKLSKVRGMMSELRETFNL
jgi:hypothetical protein